MYGIVYDKLLLLKIHFVNAVMVNNMLRVSEKGAY